MDDNSTGQSWMKWQRFLETPLNRITAEQREFLESPAGRGVDRQAVVVLVSTALLLTAQHYLFMGTHLTALVDWASRVAPVAWILDLRDWVERPENAQFARLTYWAIGQQIVYVAVPLAINRFLFGHPLAYYGAKRAGMFADWRLYLGMAAVMTPLLWIASTTERFRETYPFYRVSAEEPLWPRFWIWEGLYLAQFVALEFFFRGYVLHGLRRSLGVYAIFAMMVPYCMIHFAKPLPETCGAIVAGIALGFMSLKNRSIWLGAALHMYVALSMDLAAISRR